MTIRVGEIECLINWWWLFSHTEALHEISGTSIYFTDERNLSLFIQERLNWERLTPTNNMLTDLFYILNFTFAIVTSIVGLVFILIVIVTVATDQACRNPSNLLLCNTCTIVSTYMINNLIVSVYGFHEDWALHQPWCAFRGYCFLMSCACICYSYLIQAVSRVFFIVFYKRKYLLTFRAHWYLILFNWIIGILIAIEPIFLENGFIYERESRLCTLTTKTVATSFYGVAVAFVVPLGIAAGVYTMIFIKARQSSQRVGILNPTASRAPSANMKRESVLARNMLIVMGVFTGGGTPFLILVLWHAIRPTNPPPESFYLLIINAITLFVTSMIVALFIMSKPVRNSALRRLF